MTKPMNLLRKVMLRGRRMAKLKVKLIKRIARGGMAEIFLGKVLDNSDFVKVVAIKRILPHYGQDEEYLQMFRDEANICKRLTHSNIVQVFSFEELDESYALVMEFVNGSDLRSILSSSEKQKYRISIPMALHVAAEIARGIHYAHTKVDDATGQPLGIVHRDVSPQNILVSYDGAVKITDFGIADAKNKQTETKPGIVKGKYSYMSPEQVNAEIPDHRSDIFSLAIVLWEMLTMRRLFASDSEIETIRLVQNCRIPFRLRDISPEVHPDLEAIVDKGLAKDRRRRYQTAGDFERDLLHHLHTHYPGFTGGDLGNYVKRLFPEKRKEIQEDIRKAFAVESKAPESSGARTRPFLVSVPPDSTEDMGKGSQETQGSQSNAANPKSPAFIEPSNQPQSLVSNSSGLSQNSSVSLYPGTRATNPSSASLTSSSQARPSPKGPTRALAAHQERQRGDRRQSGRSRHRSRRSLHQRYGGLDGVQKACLFIIIVSAIIGGILATKRHFAAAELPMTLYLKTQPQAVRLNVDGQDIDGHAYQQTPTKLTMPPGQHRLRILRQGYLPEVIDFEGASGSVFREDRVTLRKSARSNWVPLRISVVPVHVRIPVTVNDGFVEGDAPLVVGDLEAGRSHTIIFFPNGDRRKGAGYRCNVSPQLGSQPTAVRIDVTNRQNPHCTILPN